MLGDDVLSAIHQRDEVQALVETALRMGEAELQRDVAVLRGILDNELRFRRANGQIVNKEDFLGDLQDSRNTFDCLQSAVVDVTVYENTAVVVLVVLAKGTREGKRFAGTFRNIRVFARDKPDSGGQWRCALWLNAKISDAGC